MKSILTAISLLMFWAFQAHAFPLPKGPKDFSILPPDFLAGFDFEGIAALSNCSGSLVRLEGSSPSDQALILTNGHCVSIHELGPGAFIYHRPKQRRFELFDSHGRSVDEVVSTEIVYATMTGTDMALYRLSDTYAEIESRSGVRALTLSSQRPAVNQAIEVVSGYWHRGYDCQIEEFVYQLREARWVMDDSIRYSRPGCQVIGGTSGSPIIASGSRTVIGVNNTGNMDGDRCLINNPCEVSETGDVFYQQGYSYGQQTYLVYSCLNAAREFDLSVPGCQLVH